MEDDASEATVSDEEMASRCALPSANPPREESSDVEFVDAGSKEVAEGGLPSEEGVSAPCAGAPRSGSLESAVTSPPDEQSDSRKPRRRLMKTKQFDSESEDSDAPLSDVVATTTSGKNKGARDVPEGDTLISGRARRASAAKRTTYQEVRGSDSSEESSGAGNGRGKNKKTAEDSDSEVCRFSDAGSESDDDAIDDGGESDESDAVATKKRRQRKGKTRSGKVLEVPDGPTRRSERAAAAASAVSYAEAPMEASDDALSEMEAENSEYDKTAGDGDDGSESSSDEDFGRSSTKGKKAKNASGKAGDKGSDKKNTEPSSDLRVQRILARKAWKPEEWREQSVKMNTDLVTKGSAWVQEDESESESEQEEGKEVERFLVKWHGWSYLHVSWETEEDLVEQIGLTAKMALTRYRKKEALGASAAVDDDFEEENLGRNDYFDPSFLEPERILEYDEPTEQVLVKWAGLSYGHCSYEYTSILNASKPSNEALMKQLITEHLAREDPSAKESLLPRVSAAQFLSDKELPDGLPFTNGGSLRDYQEVGVKWLLYNWANKRSSILADEMGLGKTLQTVAFVLAVKRSFGNSAPALVVAPLSTITHWHREFQRWTDLNVVVVTGMREDREVALRYELAYNHLARGSSGGRKLCKADVVITTPEGMLCPDMTTALGAVHWGILVVDEAHRLKNDKSKLTVTLRNSCKFERSLLLTGTPLQNSTEELWTLLNFIDSRKFGDKNKFIENYGQLEDSSQLGKLQDELRPYLLRRMKEDVEKSVPPKEETIIEVELTTVQKQYYRAIYEKNTTFLLQNGHKKMSQSAQFMNMTMELRKCCNHPYLIRGVEDDLRIHRATAATAAAKAKAAEEKAEKIAAKAAAAAAAKAAKAAQKSGSSDAASAANTAAHAAETAQNGGSNDASSSTGSTAAAGAESSAQSGSSGGAPDEKEAAAAAAESPPEASGKRVDVATCTSDDKVSAAAAAAASSTVKAEETAQDAENEETTTTLEKAAESGAAAETKPPARGIAAATAEAAAAAAAAAAAVQSKLAAGSSKAGSSGGGVSAAKAELLTERELETNNMVECAGKLVLLDKLLPRLRDQGHRVLLFSQFKMMLDVIEDYLNGRGYKHARIDGSVVGPERQRAIDDYQAPNSNIFIMMLTTRAGGVGINLTAADTCIIYDSDWNPQNDVQAMARCHRIGQTKDVKVYRLLTRKTYEMHMFHAASMKLGLDRAVLAHGGNTGIATGDRKELTKGELEALLKRGAYDVFADETNADGQPAVDASRAFREEDIDTILSRATQIVHDGGNNNNNNGSNTFSKASFVSSEGGAGAQVDIDDPDFWKKVVGVAMPEKREERLGRRLAAIGAKRYKLGGKRTAGDSGNDSDSEFEAGSGSGESDEENSNEGDRNFDAASAAAAAAAAGTGASSDPNWPYDDGSAAAAAPVNPSSLGDVLYMNDRVVYRPRGRWLVREYRLELPPAPGDLDDWKDAKLSELLKKDLPRYGCATPAFRALVKVRSRLLREQAVDAGRALVTVVALWAALENARYGQPQVPPQKRLSDQQSNSNGKQAHNAGGGSSTGADVAASKPNPEKEKEKKKEKEKRKGKEEADSDGGDSDDDDVDRPSDEVLEQCLQTVLSWWPVCREAMGLRQGQSALARARQMWYPRETFVHPPVDANGEVVRPTSKLCYLMQMVKRCADSDLMVHIQRLHDLTTLLREVEQHTEDPAHAPRNAKLAIEAALAEHLPFPEIDPAAAAPPGWLAAVHAAAAAAEVAACAHINFPEDVRVALQGIARPCPLWTTAHDYWLLREVHQHGGYVHCVNAKPFDPDLNDPQMFFPGFWRVGWQPGNARTEKDVKYLMWQRASNMAHFQVNRLPQRPRVHVARPPVVWRQPRAFLTAAQQHLLLHGTNPTNPAAAAAAQPAAAAAAAAQAPGDAATALKQAAYLRWVETENRRRVEVTAQQVRLQQEHELRWRAALEQQLQQQEMQRQMQRHLAAHQQQQQQQQQQLAQYQQQQQQQQQQRQHAPAAASSSPGLLSKRNVTRLMGLMSSRGLPVAMLVQQLPVRATALLRESADLTFADFARLLEDRPSIEVVQAVAQETIAACYADLHKANGLEFSYRPLQCEPTHLPGTTALARETTLNHVKNGLFALGNRHLKEFVWRCGHMTKVRQFVLSHGTLDELAASMKRICEERGLSELNPRPPPFWHSEVHDTILVLAVLRAGCDSDAALDVLNLRLPVPLAARSGGAAVPLSLLDHWERWPSRASFIRRQAEVLAQEPGNAGDSVPHLVQVARAFAVNEFRSFLSHRAQALRDSVSQYAQQANEPAAAAAATNSSSPSKPLPPYLAQATQRFSSSPAAAGLHGRDGGGSSSNNPMSPRENKVRPLTLMEGASGGFAEAKENGGGGSSGAGASGSSGRKRQRQAHAPPPNPSEIVEVLDTSSEGEADTESEGVPTPPKRKRTASSAPAAASEAPVQLAPKSSPRSTPKTPTPPTRVAPARGAKSTVGQSAITTFFKKRAGGS